MQIELEWNEKMWFTARADEKSAEIDARKPLGSDRGMTPKELLLASLASCTAMDVVGLLHKHRQPLERFQVRAEASLSEGGVAQTRVGGTDAEVRRLEAPYRKRVVG